MYTGRWYNTDTGLYDYRFRMVDPTLGRFLQPDPLGTIDGMNLYAYVNNNPLNFIDPWGLCKSKRHNQGGYWDAIRTAFEYIYEIYQKEGYGTIGKNDKQKHIIVSYRMAKSSNSRISRNIGVANEINDLLFGEGFNYNDLLANEIGIILREKGYTQQEAEELSKQIANELAKMGKDFIVTRKQLRSLVWWILLVSPNF